MWLRSVFQAGYGHLQYLFSRPAEPAAKLRAADLLYFLRFLKPVLPLYLLSLGLTLALSTLSSLLPLGGKLFLDFVVSQNGYGQAERILGPLYPGVVTPGLLHQLSSVNVIIAGMLLVGLAISLLGIVKAYLLRKFEQSLTFSVQSELFGRVLRFPVAYLKDKQTGYLMSRISGDVNSLAAFFTTLVNQTVISAFSALFSFCIIFALNSRLSLILLLIIPASAGINWFFSNRMRSASRSERENDAQLTREMQEILSGVEMVKIYNAEEKEARKVSDRLLALNAVRLKSLVLGAIAQFFSGSTQSLITLLIMWVGALEIMGGSMTAGDYLAFTTYSVTITGSLITLFYLQLSVQPMLASMERLVEMFKVAPESEGQPAAATPPTRGEERGHLKFQAVSFAYGDQKQVLDRVSFTASRGEIVALVGPSGAGKTTIVNLLLKFYRPDAGAILLDGQDLRDLEPRAVRNLISVVSQDIFLFNDTIENNIRYGFPEASREQVIAAARNAHIHEHIMSLPLQYETVVGEKGAKLSVGQRQRLSLARAFLKNAPLLVLDEPTSSLDTVTEAMLRDSIERLSRDRTTLIVSHRLFVSDMATRILVLKNGQIVETGTHDDLLKNGGVYSEIYSAGRMKVVQSLPPVPK